MSPVRTKSSLCIYSLQGWRIFRMLSGTKTTLFSTMSGCFLNFNLIMQSCTFFFLMSIFCFENSWFLEFFFFFVKLIFSLCWSYRIILCVCVCVFFFFKFYVHILFVGFIESQIRCKNACINLSTLTQLKIFLSLHRISYYSA